VTVRVTPIAVQLARRLPGMFAPVVAIPAAMLSALPSQMQAAILAPLESCLAEIAAITSVVDSVSGVTVTLSVPQVRAQLTLVAAQLLHVLAPLAQVGVQLAPVIAQFGNVPGEFRAVTSELEPVLADLRVARCDFAPFARRRGGITLPQGFVQLTYVVVARLDITRELSPVGQYFLAVLTDLDPALCNLTQVLPDFSVVAADHGPIAGNGAQVGADLGVVAAECGTQVMPRAPSQVVVVAAQVALAVAGASRIEPGALRMEIRQGSRKCRTHRDRQQGLPKHVLLLCL
jgi:hypothetical protein